MAALMCLVPRARKTPYTKEYADFGPTIWDQLDKRFMSKRTLVWRSLPWNYDPAPAATEMLLPAQLHVCAPPDYPLHLFPQLYGYDPGQHLEQQRIYTVIDERDVAKLLEERIVGWLERTVRLTGMRAQPRSFIVLRQRQYDLEDLSPGAVKVSGMRPAVPHFVFAYGDAETWRDGVVMILQTEPPACFENSNWDFPGDLEQAVAREATTQVVQEGNSRPGPN
ncbi:hypothetical protein KEM52_002446 [Ascosphaera acerosa]|nr:hypothetical protein KEM52_002446 [Ascosphaera acerosa]